MMSIVGALRTHGVPTGRPDVLSISRIVTTSGPPATPLKVCSNVYQPDTVTRTGVRPGFAGNAPQRVVLLLPEITNPVGSVPTLKTKSRWCMPLVLLTADDQSNRRSKCVIAHATSR